MYEVPQHYRVKVFEPRARLVNEDPKKLIQKALNNPLNSLRLEERVQPNDKVLIVCDDLTRPTPADLLLPLILDRLNKAGVPDSDIEILFALGTHRSMTMDEMQEKVGAKIIHRVACHNHNAYDESALDYFGESEEGIPVWFTLLD